MYMHRAAQLKRRFLSFVELLNDLESDLHYGDIASDEDNAPCNGDMLFRAQTGHAMEIKSKH